MSRWLCAAVVFASVALPVAGAEPTANDFLITAVARGNAEAVGRHLANPETVAKELDPVCPAHTRCKPITYAAELRDPQILQMLLVAGADPNGTNSVGDNALIVAIMNGNTLGIDVLLEFGGDVNQANYFGISAFVGAAMMGDAALVEKLHEHGGDPNAQVTFDRGNNQSSASEPLLCLVAMSGNVEVARVLLEHGANPDLPGGLGRTPADCIEASGSAPMLALLKQ